MTTAQARRARMHRRVWEASVLAPLVVCLVGCLTVDATLDPTGSATFSMTYRTAPNTTADAEKKRYGSDHVTVESLTFNDATSASLKARVDDVTKLSTAEGFKNVTVTRTPVGDDVQLTITVVNPTPATVKDAGLPGPKVTLHLPGAVREANHGATVSGDTVTWSFSLVDWIKEKTNTLIVRYAGAAKGGESPAATTPSTTTPPSTATAPAKPQAGKAAPAGKSKGSSGKH